MNRLLIFAVLVSVCSLFDDIGQIRFRTDDAGTDSSMDAADVAHDATIDPTDAAIDVGNDTGHDASVDVENDLGLTGCQRSGCLETQYCDLDTNECAPAGPCATEGCANGLVCDYRGQCVTCAKNIDCGLDAFCVGSVCECLGGENFCAKPSVRSNACVSADSLEACGEDCQTCPEPPENGDAICAPTGCDFVCRSGFVERDGACIQAGVYCDNPGGSVGGVCDPVAQTGCNAASTCVLRPASPTTLERVCLINSTLPIAQEGEACAGSSGKTCAPAHACVANICRRYCDLSNAAGCRETQYCAVGLAPTPGLGFCNDDCTL